MKKFLAVHCFDASSVVYQFQSELSKAEILSKYRRLDSELYEANVGTDDEGKDTDGQSLAKALNFDFDASDDETIDIVEVEDYWHVID